MFFTRREFQLDVARREYKIALADAPRTGNHERVEATWSHLQAAEAAPDDGTPMSWPSYSPASPVGFPFRVVVPLFAPGSSPPSKHLVSFLLSPFLAFYSQNELLHGR